jgi:chemosensory pili system protein ChpA (sensor histidine kinase/response regulator)
MSASQDYVALDWIKGEIGQTLKQAQQALEMVAETPDDMASLRACLTAIHQVHGTLQMVELAGPTQVAEEMEHLSQALMNSDVPDIGVAQEVLMQSILQMPAYLDRIQRDQQDMESNYLPIVNNLRVARGEERIEGSEPAVETGPDLAIFENPAAQTVVEAYTSANGPANLRKVRARYQQALVAILKKNNARENLGVIGKLFTMIIRLCGDSPPGYAARLGAGCIEGVISGAMKLDNGLANQLRAFDKVLKQLVDDGDGGLSQAMPESLVLGFMEALDRASSDTPKISAAKALLQDSQGADSSDEVSIGPDDETLAAVSGILKEELNGVTDKLDLFVRSADRNPQDIIELLPMLEQISSTLIVVGMTQHQKTVSDQVATLKKVDQEGLVLDDDQLLDMAGALLEIESSLGALAGDDESGDGEAFGDLNDAQAAVVRETRNALAQCRDAVIDFVSSEFDHAKIAELPSQLTTLRGGLLIVNQERSGDVLVRAADYVTTLLADKTTPELEAMDDLADAITSIDYYLERLLESANDPYMQMIEVAEDAVEKLGFPVGVAAEAPVEDGETEQTLQQETPQEPIEEELEEPEAELEPELPAPQIDDATVVETAEATTEETPETAAEAAEPAEPDSAGEVLEEGTGESVEESAEESEDLIDEEILEIFVEEVEEVLETINEFLPQWKSNPSDEEALTEVRRGYHTLKGSGRMVGATVVGELAWAVEDMLNRIIDNTIEVSDALFTLVQTVTDRIPEGVAAFKNNDQGAFEVQAMVEQAEALSRGETLPVEGAVSPETAPLDAEVDQAPDETDEAAPAEVEQEVAETEAIEAEEIEFEEEAAEEVEQVAETDAVEEFEEIEFEEEAPAEAESVAETDAIEEFEEIEFEKEAPVEVEQVAETEAIEELEEIEFEEEASVEVEQVAETGAIEELEEIEFEEEAPVEVEQVAETEAIEELEEIEFEEEAPAEVEPVAEADSIEELEEIEFEEEAPVEVEQVAETDAIEELEEIDFEEEVPAEVEPVAETDSIEELDEIEFEEEAPAEVEPVAEVDSVEELEEIEFEEEAPVEVEQVAEVDAIEELEEIEFEEEAPAEVEPVAEADSVEELEEIEFEEEAPIEVEQVSETDAVEELEEFELEEEASVDAPDEIEPAADAEQSVVDLPAPDVVVPLATEDQSEPLSADELLDEDLELDEIFVIEARQNIGVIRQFLESPGTVEGDIVAAFHTLKGSAAMAEVPTISQIAAPLEQLAGRFLSNQPDDRFLSRVKRGTGLIEQIINDLDLHRERLPGLEEFVRQFETVEEPVVDFRFDDIRLLNAVKLSPETWNEIDLGGIVAELEHVGDQAEESDHSELLALTNALLRIHRGASGVPGDDIIMGLQAGHDALLTMLDRIAASQSVGSAAPFVMLLDNLDIGPGDTAGDSAEAPAMVELPADDIDEDILPIFLEETEELLEGIDDSIQTWSEDPDGMDPLDNLLRHLHTLKGGSRMAGINSLGEFTHNFETFLISLQTKPVPFDQAFFAALNRQQDEITRRVEVYQRLAQGEASEDELSAMRFSQPVSTSEAPAVAVSEVVSEATSEAAVPPSDEAPEPVAAETVELPADDVDEDILPIFLEETEELLEGIDESIQNWSESTAEAEHLDNLLRHLHTLKGGARMAGLNSLGEYAHNFETYLIGIQKEPVELNEQFFSMVNQRQDEMTRRVEVYNRLAAGEATDEELASLVSATEPVAASATTPELAQSVEEPVAAAAETAAEPVAAVTPQEMVRVSSDLLEDLISLAGESSITRGRVEQQISDFGDSLEEMEDTISRVRDQVRRLEIEAESRETLVSQQGGMGEEGFDELEMDRYTMLQEISRTLNEGTSDMLDLKDTLVNRSRDAELLLHQQARIASELQEGLTRTRMVPFARLIPRLRRIVRQVSAEIGKNVRFDAFNVEGELDRNVLDRIVAPLEHMLRNAVDHGIEDVEKRKQAGKPDQGRISLRLSREGGYVILTISDDGGGINVDAVRTKAIERGLITADSNESDHEVMQFIMHAGFSTAQKLTQISGRGVGMDVVGSEIKALGGSMSIDSTLGVGSEFTISIPFTVSINRALMVVVREETYAVPLNTIEGIVRVSPYELEAYYQPDAPMFEYAGQPYRLEYMGKMLDKSDNPNLEGLVAQLPVILARSGDNAVALQVDRVIGSREVVVKTLGAQFNEVGGISGATVLGDGSVVIILDVMALVRGYSAVQPGTPAAVEEPEPEVLEKVRTVMIVDDSVTVRKVTSRLMERQGWEVITAKDGLDAVTQLQDIYPDVVLLDIEMPKMDGFEVLRRVRGDERLQKLPIIMITSRTGEKHQEQALELGVNSFLGKPFQEANLISTIEEVISGAR